MTKEELLSSDNCRLCPRNCHADRNGTQKGFCGEGSCVRIARAALHFWEEPCISGKVGSGAVFFTGCSLRCIFCQNHNIADGTVGREVTSEQLADIFLMLQTKGAANINLVTAGHFLLQVVEALHLAKEKGLKIPIVYNSSGYERVEAIRQLSGLVDIYLPDCKYYDSALSRDFSHAPDYFEIAAAAIAEMVTQAGELSFDETTGLMKRGVIIRHLILPGHTKDSMKVLKYLHDTYQDSVYISIMNQYTPVVRQSRFPELNRTVTKREYEKVIDFALQCGITQAFIQEGQTAKESFIPQFDYEGVPKE